MWLMEEPFSPKAMNRWLRTNLAWPPLASDTDHPLRINTAPASYLQLMSPSHRLVT